MGLGSGIRDPRSGKNPFRIRNTGGISQRRRGGSKRSLRGSLDQWSLISITLMRSRIQLRIRNKVKCRIRISITVIRGIQVHIKVMGIHKTDFRSGLSVFLIRIWPKRLLMTTHITELASFRVFCLMFFFKMFFLLQRKSRTRKRICANKVKWSSYGIFETFFKLAFQLSHFEMILSYSYVLMFANTARNYCVTGPNI